MSDALPLPPRPNLEQYRKLAKDLRRACASGDSGAVRAWALSWVETLARLRGFAVDDRLRSAQAREAEGIEARWRRLGRPAPCKLADAQFFLAREHGFLSWPKFTAHLESLARPGSTVAAFESAVEAIVRGDAATLRRLLREYPGLACQRSTRDHRSTLLHYVSANGVEDFRQQTPQNIVEIANLLLDAGAEVNAVSDAYGGGSTTLGLVATSVHPEQAGVQIPLLEALLARGAAIEQPGIAGNQHGAVKGCLANGQGRAARFFAERGAPLDLEEAAGVGRLDVVQTFFDERGALRPPATLQQMESGFLYGCGYGRLETVRFLLDRGADPNLQNGEGQTGLHWSAYGPHVEVAALLVERGARVDVKDGNGRTPLMWALGAWARTSGKDHDRARDLVDVLVRGGARVDLGALPPRVANAIQADPRMMAAIGV